MKIDPRQMMGRQFDALGYPPAAYTEEFRGWHADEGMDPDWTVALHDKSLQFLLTASREVKTIFVLSGVVISEVLGIAIDAATLATVVAKLGSPTNFGEESDLGVLGLKGAWLRYDNPGLVLHVEFHRGGAGISMLTLMDPEHAP